MVGFPDNGISILSRAEKHFWFQWRNEIIKKSLSKIIRPHKGSIAILELGCGSGVISKNLRQKRFNLFVSDYNEASKKYIPPDIKFFKYDISKDFVPSEHTGRYDILILGDVLEHLENPVGDLKKSSTFLKPGGHLLVTVPALKQLWSSYDVHGGHKKRYSKSELKTEIELSGYSMLKIDFFMIFPAIILFFQRKLSFSTNRDQIDDGLNISRYMNTVMSFMMSLEKMILKMVKAPFGSSLIAIGVKDEG